MDQQNNTIKGIIVDVVSRTMYTAEIKVAGKYISTITRIPDEDNARLPYIVPGFIDSHVHIESSMLIPSQFSRLAVEHGTVATVSDPHEIANVCGMAGVEYMIKDGKKAPLKFHFGAPSCVPATTFETAGAVLNADDVEKLLKSADIKYLSEMMNFPGVLNNDPDVIRKIKCALDQSKPVDGHAPGLRGESAAQYIAAGISTDHECFTSEEAEEKLKLGMKILIREGSAAKNFSALIGLLEEYPGMIMFCSDDKHPDSLVEGHINELCARAVQKGIDIYKVLQAACIDPVLHYNLDVGLLREGDTADFVLLKDLSSFVVQATYIDGVSVTSEEFKKNASSVEYINEEPLNNFHPTLVTEADLAISIPEFNGLPVIEALDGQLITNKSLKSPQLVDNSFVADIENDVLKIVVVNRYIAAPVAKAFITNLGLKKGAIASSVAHDSHNIVAVGTNDADLANAINILMDCKGGISCVSGEEQVVLPLPVAGLMSMEDGYIVAKKYTELEHAAKSLGSTLSSPFMTLSFMALLVIPEVKLSDRGLFDVASFSFFHPQTWNESHEKGAFQ